MEVLLGILVVGILFLWWRTSELDRAGRSARSDLTALQVETSRLRAAVADLQFEASAHPGAEERAAQRAARAEASMAADLGEPLAKPAKQPPAPIGAAPEVPAQATIPDSVAAAASVTPATSMAAAASEEAAHPTIETAHPTVEAPVEVAAIRGWVVPEPAGPSLVERTLAVLGLATPDGEPMSRAALEAWLEGRMLAIVGGIALLLGAVFFLSLAFSRGWITEEMRVLIGLGAGAGAMVLGELAFTRLRGIVGHVLVAVGLAIVSLALFAATAQYHLVIVELGLAGAFVAAIAAATIAVRHDSQLVAAFGLATVLAAPPVLGASPTLITLLFVAAALVGTTAIALFRTWVWLPPLAFVLAGPQLASYVLGTPAVGEAFVAIAGFWLVNVVAAGGEETRHRTDRLRTTTVTLLLANAAFTVWAGFVTLSGSLEEWRGTFLAVMAIAHLGLGLLFLLRFDDRHPFGLVVAATGVASLTMAVPVQFGGPPVPIAWAAEAVALAWVAVLRRHPYSSAVSVLLGALAIGHLVVVEYPWGSLLDGYARTIPFVGPEGMTFGFMIAALAITAAIVPIGWIRALLGAAGGLIAIYVGPFELSGPALVAFWSALSALGLVAFARVVEPRLAASFRERRVASLALPAWAEPLAAAMALALSALARPAFLATAVLAGLAALLHLPAFDEPLDRLFSAPTPAFPFIDPAGLSFAFVLVAIAVTGVLVGWGWVRLALAAVAGAVALYVFPFELSGPALVWAWSALGALALVVEARILEPRLGAGLRARGWAPKVVPVRPAILVVGAAAIVAALDHLLVVDFPLARVGQVTLSAIPYLGPEALSLLAAFAALGVGAWASRRRWVVLGSAGIALALVVYTLTFEVRLPHLAAAWGLTALAAVALVRRIAPVDLFGWDRGGVGRSIAERLPYLAAGLGILCLAIQSLILAPPVEIVDRLAGTIPPDPRLFLDDRTYVLVATAIVLVASGLLWRSIDALAVAAVATAVPIAWLLPFEIRPGYAVAGWSLMALGGFGFALRAPRSRDLLAVAAVTMLALGIAVTLAAVAPPDRLLVDASTTVIGWAWLTDASVALAAIGVAFGIGAFLHRPERLTLVGFGIAGVTLVYLLSVAVVDAFQREVGTRPLDELQFQAQVGLSVLWSILGGLAFAAGLLAHRPPVRLFGLALLGLATVKVFLVDLVGLPIEQRVLSLVALGVLLLVSATVYGRLQHPHGPTPKHA